jgi:carbamoyltransferase
MFILGVNSAYHESAAALIHDGRIVAATEEERFCRVKHAKRARVDNAHELPWQAIEFCLQRAGIDAAEVAHVGYSLDPEARLQANLNLPDSHRCPAGDFGSPDGEQAFHASNRRALALLGERFGNARVQPLEHHLCHAASAYTVAPVEDAAVLAVDGIGEFNSTWLGVGRGGQLEHLDHVPYPHSLGFLWEKMSLLLGFDAYSGPGKMMGYGAITDPLGELTERDHLATMREIVTLEPDGSFRVDNEVLRFRGGDFSELERRFGPRRPQPVDRYEDASVAAALQVITEEALLHLARGLHRRLAETPGGAPETLCLAGGVALNCVANDKLLRQTPFSRLWIQPAANDAGTALGAAALLHVRLGLPGRPRMEHAYLGPAFGDAALSAALEQAGLSYSRCQDVAAEVAQRLDRGQIVAWFQGAQEFGPRALGNRSILADPTRFDTRQRLNSQVKNRESFRPFAPSVLEREVGRLFQLPAGTECADYMLTASPLADDRYSQVIPAVVQENGSIHRSTSRLHRVRSNVAPLYHRVIEAFADRSGVGAVLNTSFNISEPIVTTPQQAIATFGRSRMDALVLGPYLVESRD